MIKSFNSLKQFSAYKQQQYNKVYAHELAHKNAAGAFGGPIVIEKDANGVAIAGHVSIKMPVLNRSNPKETINHANTVIKAALAPSDPSGQDLKVASQARAILAEAKNLQQGSKLNYFA